MAGFSLLEAVLSVGLLSVVVLGAMAAFGSVATVSSSDPMRDAAEREMRRILTLESAAAKYTDPNALAVNPTPWRTSMPFSGGTPVPITVSATTGAPNAAPSMTVTVTYPHQAGPLSISKSFAIVRKAPAPQTSVAAPGTYADPNATPTP